MMNGYKRSGYFEGLVGEITNCDIKGFEHLLRITFKSGASVLAAHKDVTFTDINKGVNPCATKYLN